MTNDDSMLYSRRGASIVILLSFVLVIAIVIDRKILTLDLTGHDTPWSRQRPFRGFEWDGKRPLYVLFMTWGSRGDHQPNVALGLELARRGHNVTVMGMAKYRDVIERHASLRYVELVDGNLWDMAEAFARSEGADFMALTKTYVTRSAQELVGQYLREGEHADVLIGSHSAMLMLHHITVADHLSKPLFFLTHDLTLPTAAYSFNPSESRVMDYGKRTNVFNHRIFSILFGAMITMVGDGNGGVWRTLRRELGLDTPVPFMELLHPDVLADYPTFYTCDSTLWPPPADRPPHWYPTGFFVTRDDSLGVDETTEKLLDWIRTKKSKGRQVIYLGQGSFDHHSREVFTDILIDTLAKLGGTADAISLRSTVDERQDLPDTIYVVDQLNQDLVFPMVDVISHHGGAGTSSQVVRSGRPGIGIPSMPFQNVWSAQLADYGAGINLNPKQLMEAWEVNGTNLLAEAVRAALEPSVIEKAAKLGEAARNWSDGADGGVELAASAMIRHLSDLVVVGGDSAADEDGTSKEL